MKYVNDNADWEGLSLIDNFGICKHSETSENSANGVTVGAYTMFILRYGVRVERKLDVKVSIWFLT